jgi:Spy/CpxP family protein refolding chaperone
MWKSARFRLSSKQSDDLDRLLKRKGEEEMKKFAVRHLALAMALLFILGVTLASAQNGSYGHGKMGGFGIMRGLSKLNLTESQKNDVRQILDSRKATLQTLHDQARANWDALRTVSESSAPDTSAVGAAFLKLRASRQALRAERESAMQQIRPVLTTDQQNQLDAMKQQRLTRFQNRMGMQGSTGR